MIEKLRQYKLHHISFWVTYFFFWVKYYTPYYENIIDLYGVTGIYLFAHASLFYLMRWLFLSENQKKLNSFLLIIIYLALCGAISFVMYGMIKLWLGVMPEEIFKADFMQVIMFFSISNFFTVGALLVLAIFSHNKRQQRKVEAMEKERLETELQYLKAQVNPHFLFNTINSIYVLIKIDPEKASDTLIKLSNLLRSQLYEFTEDRIDIAKELDYLENYLALEKIRKGERLDLKFEKEGNLSGFKIAPLMLIPFLENCFKHLSTYTDRPNIVQINIKRNGKLLEATFFNTCEDKNVLKEQEVGGIGLNNIKRRLELVYPKQHELNIRHDQEGYFVHLKIKLEV
ncbi:histidine kinase [Belliella sp. R4-6]|uniref:Histidine kinase n=1 Tax=Belliella alkalica TaxID=1730871 RepID=A0ABS9V9X1_9BACT|nr:histidine kinase [Belliella alkalica]MCH7413227.1 histidine kinase [Belliella alkalica]